MLMFARCGGKVFWSSDPGVCLVSEPGRPIGRLFFFLLALLIELGQKRVHFVEDLLVPFSEGILLFQSIDDLDSEI